MFKRNKTLEVGEEFVDRGIEILEKEGYHLIKRAKRNDILPYPKG